MLKHFGRLSWALRGQSQRRSSLSSDHLSLAEKGLVSRVSPNQVASQPEAPLNTNYTFTNKPPDVYRHIMGEVNLQAHCHLAWGVQLSLPLLHLIVQALVGFQLRLLRTGVLRISAGLHTAHQAHQAATVAGDLRAITEASYPISLATEHKEWSNLSSRESRSRSSAVNSWPRISRAPIN